MSIFYTHTQYHIGFGLLFSLLLALQPITANAQTNSAPLTIEEAEILYEDIAVVREQPGAPPEFSNINSAADIQALSPSEQDTLQFLASIPGPSVSPTTLDPALDVCFDYYTFDSVDVSIQSQNSNQLMSGTEGAFTVTLTNTNPYPIVDTGVYLKLYRELAPGEATTHMHNLVDEWQAFADLSIPAGETITRDFTYDIPAGAPTGPYRLVGYVATAEAYNLAGLPFTDDVFGGVYSFQIQGEGTGTVAFDRTRTFVNQSQYYFASYAPQVDQAAPIDLVTFLENTTTADAQAEITWEVYRWDQQREAHRLSSETNTVAVAAGDTVPLTYTVTDTDYPVYLVAATAQVGDMTSRINVRVVREGLTQTRLNFPGVTNYPLTPGEETTLFSCAHNTSNVDQVPGGRIELELTDQNGEIIHAHTYEGSITGAMMATADTFTPARRYDTFTLTATLFQDEQIVETVSLSYDCTELGVPCRTPDDTTGGSPLGNLFASDQWPILTVMGIILIIVIGGAIFRYRNRRTEPATDDVIHDTY